jgi:hypothetical protein
VPPNFVGFFFTMNQFDWPVTQKNETMEAPQDKRFYFEVLSSSPLAHPYGWKEDNNLPKHMGLKWDAMENMLGNTLGTWAILGTHCELKGNTLGTREKWKKNPSSSQQSLGWAPNSNLIQFPWPQGISFLQNGPFYEAEGPMPDFAGLHRGV